MSEKSLEMSYLQVFTYQEEPELAPPVPLESLGMERTRETVPTEAGGCIIADGQEAKTETLGRL